jgi:hypothetical protein
MREKAERIACFDAAARIATVGAARKSPTVVVASPLAAAPVSEIRSVQIPPAFSGWYAGLGGSYGIGAPRRISAFASLPPISGASFIDNGSPEGWSGSFVAGTNVLFGNLLLGLEASGRWGHESLSRSSTIPVSALDAEGNTPQSGQIIGTYKFDSDASAHISGRAGLWAGDTMVFAKAGIGATRITETVSFAGAGDICAAFGSSPPFFRTVCLFRRPIGSGSAAEARWMPSVILGTGVEQNFGNWFVRLGADAEAIIGAQATPGVRGFLQPGGDQISGSSSSGSGITDYVWTVRASALVGLRF